jgi:hypothetical protein
MDEVKFWNYINSLNWPDQSNDEAKKKAMLGKSPKEAEEHYQYAITLVSDLAKLLAEHNIYSNASCNNIAWNVLGKGESVYTKCINDPMLATTDYLSEDEESFKYAIPSEDDYYSF